MRSNLILIAFCILLTGCATEQYVNVPISYNAKYSFKPDSTTIVLINQFDLGGSKINQKTLNVIKAGAFSSIKYAGEQLMQLPHVKVINLVDSAAFVSEADSARIIAGKYNADFVLALKTFSAGIGLGSVDNSTAYYNTNVTVNFLLYESNGIYYKKLNGSANDPQSEGAYPGLVASLLIHPTVKGNKSSIIYSAQHAAYNALQDYFPTTVNHNRPLFNDEFLQPANKEILAARFDKAYNLLQPFLKSTDVQVAAKAAYNLAVVYEAQGDIDIAISMAQQSLDKFNSRYASSILTDLKAE